MTGTDAPRFAALVTGASSGIGRSIALRLAKAGHDLALVARNETELRSVAEEATRRWGVHAYVCALDLSEPGAAGRLWDILKQAEIGVDILVNNAGFALHGPTPAVEPEKEAALVRLQITTTLELIGLALTPMRQRGRGRVLNVASVYSFIPVPNQAVYGACKAFMASYSAALAEELKPDGITVSLLAPGTTRTEFRRSAGLHNPRAERGGMDPEVVAEIAYAGMMRGQTIIVPGTFNKVLLLLAGLLPRARRAAVMGAVNARRGLGTHMPNG